MSVKLEILKKYHELTKYYQLRPIFEFLNLLRDSGIVNMFGASPFLYGGKQFIESEIKRRNDNSRWWSDDEDEEDEDEEEKDDNQELINMAEKVRNLMIQGAMNRITNQDSENFVRDVSRRMQRDSTEIVQVWGNFKGKVMKESVINKKDQFIKKILKEETSLQNKVLNLINTKGLIIATKIVGGIERIASILDKTPEKLLTKYLSQETFSTDDINKDTGGYNFKFKLQYVKKSPYYTGEYDFYYLVEEGTVTLIMTDDETEYDLQGDDVRELDMWWEIKHEIRDVLYDFTEELIEKLKLDFGSANVNYLFKGRNY